MLRLFVIQTKCLAVVNDGMRVSAFLGALLIALTKQVEHGPLQI